MSSAFFPKKISEFYKNNSKPTISFEFFPSKTEEGKRKLFQTINELKPLNPDFVSITCGANGSTGTKTQNYSDEIQKKYEITVMVHYTSIGISREDVESNLRDLEKNRIKNILALRGDLPKNSMNYQIPKNGFKYANELIEYIRKKNFDFSIGGACYPEVHVEASSPQVDLDNLKRKVDTGVDFLITQLFFLNEKYYRFVEKCQKHNITIPIVPGIMPISNYKQIEKFSTMTGCQIPQELKEKLSLYETDEDALFKISHEYCVSQCKELLKNGTPGLHFYTLNKNPLILRIFKSLKI